MKKKLFFITLMIMTIQLGAQEPKIKYVSIDGYLNLPLITISSMDEYIKLIQKKDISTLFLYTDKKNKLDTSVLVKDNDVYYRFCLNGYTSIDDYIKGNELKYQNGQDYYESHRLGFFITEQYYYYTRNSFISVEDAIDAYNNGYIFEKYELQDVILPIELTDQAWNVLDRYFPKCRGRIYNMYQDGKIKDVSQSLISIYALELQTTGIKKDQKTVIKEDQIFYLAKLSKIDTYKLYLDTYKSRKNGFLTFQDFSEASSKGYNKGSDYYNAKKLGFDLYNDYIISQKLKIDKPLEYQLYRPIFDSIEKTRKEYEMDLDDALIYYFISQIPLGSQISIEKLSYNLSSMLSKYSKLKNYNSTYNESLLTVARIEKFLLKENINDIGNYDKQSGIFNRKLP